MNISEQVKWKTYLSPKKLHTCIYECAHIVGDNNMPRADVEEFKIEYNLCIYIELSSDDIQWLPKEDHSVDDNYNRDK